MMRKRQGNQSCPKQKSTVQRQPGEQYCTLSRITTTPTQSSPGGFKCLKVHVQNDAPCVQFEEVFDTEDFRGHVLPCQSRDAQGDSLSRDRGLSRAGEASLIVPSLGIFNAKGKRMDEYSL